MVFKAILSVTLTLGLLGFAMPHSQAAAVAPAKKSTPVKTSVKQTVPVKSVKPVGVVDTSYKDVSPLDLVKDPTALLNQKISFEADFVTFSGYALDYKPALRPAKDYIAFLVRRPDVNHHVIPLAELKLIYPRKKAEKVLDIESTDHVLVRGKVFSTALGDPWMDVEDLILLKKSPENIAKAAKNKKKTEQTKP